MIRLIVTDCDGTLMPESTRNLNPAYYDEIRRISEKGIMFAAVSGREYPSLEMLMSPVKDVAVLVADNGAVLMQNGRDIYTVAFELPMMRDIIRYVRTIPEADYYFISTHDGAVTDSKNEKLIRSLEDAYNEKIIRIKDALQIDTRPMKVAVHTPAGSKNIVGDARAFFGDRVNVVESGTYWMDFIPPGADKGKAVEYLQNRFNISRKETIAFGDNINDITLLQAAGTSYAVAEAREEVKRIADHTIGSYKDDSVLQILRSI